MKIDLNDIPPEGVSLELTENEESFKDIFGENGYGFHILSPVAFHLTIKKKGREVAVDGSAKAKVKKVCSRCLKEFEEEGDWKITSAFVIYGDKVLEIDGDPEPSSLHGSELDTTEIIREQLTWDLPMKFLCKDDCKGLCVKCGVDLNEKTCDCFRVKEVDPRFSLLKDLKIE